MFDLIRYFSGRLAAVTPIIFKDLALSRKLVGILQHSSLPGITGLSHIWQPALRNIKLM